MSKFPDAIPLSRQVITKRLRRRKELILASRRGIYLRLTLIAIELGGVILWKSSALFLDMLSSLVDVMTSLLLIWFIHLADRPPDEEHPFGHGRFEPVAGLCIGFLLIFLGLFNGIEQVKSLYAGTREAMDIPLFAWIIPFTGVVLLEICHKFLKRCAKKEKSPALMADAAHYRIDALVSLFALLALFFAAVIPEKATLFDSMGALAIALFMLVVGTGAVRKNIRQLLDHSPDKEYFHLVREAALSVEGVRATEKLKIQAYGPDAHVAIDIEVDPHLPVADAHTLSQKVRRNIQLAWPSVRDVIVHIEPYYPNDHELR